MQYYYLDSNFYSRRTGIRIPTLKKDMQRGVKHLSDFAYAKYSGYTRSSLQFFNVLSKLIDVSKVKRAVLTYSQRKHWTLFLHSSEGYKIVLKGVSGGYSGEGTRGCYDVLKACGFNDKQCMKAFEHETFEVRKLN